MKDKESYDKSLNELIYSIDLCFKNQFLLPGLTLLYSLIDIMAWLSRPSEQDDVTRSDFINWVNKYLLSVNNFNCTAQDLYGARCALIHSGTAESKLSRDGGARSIYYTIGNKDAQRLQNDVDSVGCNAVVIQVDVLFKTLINSIENFKNDIQNNLQLADIVNERSNKLFTYLS
ncbi:MAG TPA: hypothetical protein VMU30_10745 [Bacteroidota bacterium]|nr:hypothetical protein [Bacteroidota bacterium]